MTESRSSTIAGRPRGARPFAHGDIDGDGDLDLVIADPDKARVLYMLEDEGRFVVESAPSLAGITSLALGDIDGDGKQVWTSDGKASFDLGSFLLADGMFFILDGNTGTLRLVEANVREYRELASAQILSGHDVWAPLALSQGKLVIRDLQRMVCLQVGKDG